MTNPLVKRNTPLSEQIYAAHIEWAAAQRDFHILESQRTVVKQRKITEQLDLKAARTETAAKRLVEGSEWYQDYLRELVEAEYTALNARGKWEYLQEAAKESRDASFQERLMAKI